MVTLIHVEGSLWLCEEMGQVGEVSEAPNGDVLFEFFDHLKDGLNLKRWHRWEVVLRS